MREQEPMRNGTAKRKSGNERGIALLMSLAILSIMLLLAVTFHFTSRTALRSSEINADITRGRLLAESALERAIAFIHNEGVATPVADDATAALYPATSGNWFRLGQPAIWAGRYYGVSISSEAESRLIENALHTECARHNGRAEPGECPQLHQAER
jgi:hypothetical protein